jgi:hypothetical protein
MSDHYRSHLLNRRRADRALGRYVVELLEGGHPVGHLISERGNMIGSDMDLKGIIWASGCARRRVSAVWDKVAAAFE